MGDEAHEKSKKITSWADERSLQALRRRMMMMTLFNAE
jgi:hypothetical protein